MFFFQWRQEKLFFFLVAARFMVFFLAAARFPIFVVFFSGGKIWGFFQRRQEKLGFFLVATCKFKKYLNILIGFLNLNFRNSRYQPGYSLERRKDRKLFFNICGRKDRKKQLFDCVEYAPCTGKQPIQGAFRARGAPCVTDLHLYSLYNTIQYAFN